MTPARKHYDEMQFTATQLGAVIDAIDLLLDVEHGKDWALGLMPVARSLACSLMDGLDIVNRPAEGAA